MITTNGAKIITYNKIIGSSAPDLVLTDGTAQTATVSATTQAFRRCGYNNTAGTLATSDSCMVMNLGVGTAQPSTSDYWLDETEVDGVDVNTLIECARPQGDTWSPVVLNNGDIVYTYSFLNTSNRSITITELGLSFACMYGKILCGRHLIPARVIEPGETVTFSYELNFN
jgi:hypothetical protein